MPPIPFPKPARLLSFPLTIRSCEDELMEEMLGPDQLPNAYEVSHFPNLSPESGEATEPVGADHLEFFIWTFFDKALISSFMVCQASLG